MKRLNPIWISILFAAGILLGAPAQYDAEITLNSGSSFVVESISVSGDRLYFDSEEQASTSVSSIKAVDFHYEGINLGMCESMFRSGKLKSLDSLLLQYVEPTLKYNYLPGNIGDYLVWMLRVQIWDNDHAAAEKTIEIMSKMDDGRIVDFANMYFTFMLLEQGKADSAAAVFGQILNPEAVSMPMAEYLRGRLAFERGDYRKTLKRVANVLAFHSRNMEWMPPTTVLEAQTHKQTGQFRKAETVANELMMTYPGTQWSELGEKIKKEVQQ